MKFHLFSIVSLAAFICSEQKDPAKIVDMPDLLKQNSFNV